MKFYFVVEGRQTEKKVYAAWTQLVFPDLVQQRSSLPEIQEDQFFIFSSGGYPFSGNLLTHVVNDLKRTPVDHLFVCVDAEDEAVATRRARIEQELAGLKCPCPYHVIIANRCMESWFLGNRKMMTHRPEGHSTLHTFWEHYDVRTRDPEDMPHPGETVFQGTTAEYHQKYLKEMFRAKGLRYSKEFPGETQDEHYFDALVERRRETNHLASFGQLIDTWSGLGSPRLKAIRNGRS
ncbi:MAG: hypothetical protein HQM01_06260 [Magnetococcales bacterium]|nr:hypothetical protein [Magnetococcales bacterium]